MKTDHGIIVMRANKEVFAVAVIVMLGLTVIGFNHVAWIQRVEQIREWNGIK
jgi:hypothetical protein